MAVDTQNAKVVRFRTVTMSLRVDSGVDEQVIVNALDKWHSGIKGSAYILHDKDVYTHKEARSMQKAIDDAIKEKRDAGTLTLAEEQVMTDEKAKLAEGVEKPAHWHILLDFGVNAKPVDSIATLFGTETHMIQSVRGRKKGFANMLAYLTHITSNAQADNKYEYASDEVKGLKFPHDEAYSEFQTYADFAVAFEKDELNLDVNAKMVLDGKLTPDELMKKDGEYYLNNMTKVEKARLKYVNSIPTPKNLFNYYVGTKVSEDAREGQQGRIGKGLTCLVLALANLKMMHPDVDFDSMTNDDLTRKGYVYWAGGAGVSLQRYDGQPIIIWEDVRGYDLIKAFGGVGRLFGALDTHPKPISFNIKYGDVYLKNCINIIDSVQTYDEFISDLSIEWMEQMNAYGEKRSSRHTKEDKSQAKGRFPFFIEVTQSMITVNAQLQYLVGTMSSVQHNFKHSCRNDLRVLAEHGRLGEACESIGGRCVRVTEQIKNDEIRLSQVPSIPMQMLTSAEEEFYSKLDGVRYVSDVITED